MTNQGNLKSIIEATGVDKHYGSFHALKGVTASFYEGQVTAIIGPSGSGKSTFLRTLNRLETHSAGTICVDGIELNDDMKNLDAVRREVDFHAVVREDEIASNAVIDAGGVVDTILFVVGDDVAL